MYVHKNQTSIEHIALSYLFTKVLFFCFFNKTINSPLKKTLPLYLFRMQFNTGCSILSYALKLQHNQIHCCEWAKKIIIINIVNTVTNNSIKRSYESKFDNIHCIVHGLNRKTRNIAIKICRV